MAGSWAELLWSRTLWSWERDRDLWHSVGYHWFNIAEGVIWTAIALAVFVRYWKHRRSRLEIAYAAAFLVFGLTDFREAWLLHGWLLWLKALIVIAILLLRRTILRRFYPDQKVF